MFGFSLKITERTIITKSFQDYSTSFPQSYFKGTNITAMAMIIALASATVSYHYKLSYLHLLLNSQNSSVR